MVKIALIRVYESTHDIGYGDGDYETYRSLEGLDFKEVTEDELRELREAVSVYNKQVPQKGYSLALIAQATAQDEVTCLAALKSYRDKLQREAEAAAKAHAEALQKRKAAQEQRRLKKLAKELGVSVEDVVQLQRDAATKKS